MLRRKARKAFTMLELVFVIVIMAILAKFGVEFMAKAYESFIFSKINNTLQSRSGAAVEFIAKRLEYRIKPSLIYRNTVTKSINYISDSGLSDENATVLEWIATDIDGFRGTTNPHWSGVIDLNKSNMNYLVSPATHTDTLDTLIKTLSYHTNTDIDNTAIYFPGSPMTTNPWGYQGAIADQSQTLHPIKSGAHTDELFPKNFDFHNIEVFEFYKLAWTAYAIELDDYNDTTHLGNLYFYYDYRPWKGESYNKHGKKVLLAENINNFRFRSAGSLVKIQVCAKSDLTNEEYALCKEKTVY